MASKFSLVDDVKGEFVDAPRSGALAKGTAPVTGTSQANALKRKMDDAFKAGDINTFFDLVDMMSNPRRISDDSFNDIMKYMGGVDGITKKLYSISGIDAYYSDFNKVKQNKYIDRIYVLIWKLDDRYKKYIGPSISSINKLPLPYIPKNLSYEEYILQSPGQIKAYLDKFIENFHDVLGLICNDLIIYSSKPDATSAQKGASLIGQILLFALDSYSPADSSDIFFEILFQVIPIARFAKFIGKIAKEVAQRLFKNSPKIFKAIWEIIESLIRRFHVPAEDLQAAAATPKGPRSRPPLPSVPVIGPESITKRAIQRKAAKKASARISRKAADKIARDLEDAFETKTIPGKNVKVKWSVDLYGVVYQKISVNAISKRIGGRSEAVLDNVVKEKTGISIIDLAKNSGGGGPLDLHWGHIMSSILDGVDNAWNLVVMDSRINLSHYKTLVDNLYKTHLGKSVIFTVEYASYQETILRQASSIKIVLDKMKPMEFVDIFTHPEETLGDLKGMLLKEAESALQSGDEKRLQKIEQLFEPFL